MNCAGLCFSLGVGFGVVSMIFIFASTYTSQEEKIQELKEQLSKENNKC